MHNLPHTWALTFRFTLGLGNFHELFQPTVSLCRGLALLITGVFFLLMDVKQIHSWGGVRVHKGGSSFYSLNVRRWGASPKIKSLLLEANSIILVFTSQLSLSFTAPKYSQKGTPHLDWSIWRGTSFAGSFKAELEERLIRESSEKQIKLSAGNSAWLEFKCTSSLTTVGSWVP